MQENVEYAEIIRIAEHCIDIHLHRENSVDIYWLALILHCCLCDACVIELTLKGANIITK